MPRKKTSPHLRTHPRRFPKRNDVLLDGLSIDAWKVLWVVAWKRLGKINPKWRHIISEEFWSFGAIWHAFTHNPKYRDPGVFNYWVGAAFQHMLKTSPTKGQQSDSDPRSIWNDFKKLRGTIQSIKDKNPNIGQAPLSKREKFWRHTLQPLLNDRPSRKMSEAWFADREKRIVQRKEGKMGVN